MTLEQWEELQTREAVIALSHPAASGSVVSTVTRGFKESVARFYRSTKFRSLVESEQYGNWQLTYFASKLLANVTLLAPD